jgi:hypothetical protein
VKGEGSLKIRVLLVPAILAVAVASSAAATTATVPTKLVGSYSRTVTDASNHRFKASAQLGLWAMTIGKTGKFEIVAPKPPPNSTSRRLKGRITVTGRRFSITTGCKSTNVFGWKVSGKLLTVTYVTDKSCPGRAAVMVGVWRRK